jgi:hypothetical protein
VQVRSSFFHTSHGGKRGDAASGTDGLGKPYYWSRNNASAFTVRKIVQFFESLKAELQNVSHHTQGIVGSSAAAVGGRIA